MSPVLVSRQVNNPNNPDYFWWSTTGVIVKWSILAAITLFFTTWFVGGYYHARRRLRRGLRPLWYHAVSFVNSSPHIYPLTQSPQFLVPYQYRRPPPLPQNHADFYRMDNVGYRVGQQNNFVAAPLPPAYGVERKSSQADGYEYDVPPPGEPPVQAQIQAELPPREPNKPSGLMSKINPFRK